MFTFNDKKSHVSQKKKKKKNSSHDASNSALMNKILPKIHTNEENTEVIDTGSELNVTNNHQEM